MSSDGSNRRDILQYIGIAGLSLAGSTWLLRNMSQPEVIETSGKERLLQDGLIRVRVSNPSGPGKIRVTAIIREDETVLKKASREILIGRDEVLQVEFNTEIPSQANNITATAEAMEFPDRLFF